MTGCSEERDQRRELDVALRRGQRRGRPGRGRRTRGRAAARAPSSAARVEGERDRRLQVARGRRPGAGAARSAWSVPPDGGGVEGVEQLTEGYGGWPLLAGRLVGAAVGDHQLLARRDDRVEHQLAVLAAQVALAGQRVAREHVVAVDRAGAREDAVVEAEQADHAVGHRAHRHHRADGERAGAEVGPGRLAGEALATSARVRRAAAARARPAGRGVEQPGQLALDLADLPLVAAGHRGELVDAVAAARPASGRPGGCRSSRSVTSCSRSTNSASRPARSMLVTADVVERQRRTDAALGVVADIATPASTRSRPKRQVFWT